jgi:hypothetical protein
MVGDGAERSPLAVLIGPADWFTETTERVGRLGRGAPGALTLSELRMTFRHGRGQVPSREVYMMSRAG